jgi:2'-5' RNA ligase
LFIAAYPPGEVLAHFKELASTLWLAQPQPLGRSLRFESTERWHITLAFLGEVPEERAEAAAAALPQGGRPVRLSIAGGGRFGEGRFTVVWAGLRGDIDGLHALSTGIRARLTDNRLAFDQRPLQPHLTLARPRDRLRPDRLAEDLHALDRYQGPEWTMDDVRLMRSYLGRPPRYETLARATDQAK